MGGHRVSKRDWQMHLSSQHKIIKYSSVDHRENILKNAWEKNSINNIQEPESDSRLTSQRKLYRPEENEFITVFEELYHCNQIGETSGRKRVWEVGGEIHCL